MTCTINKALLSLVWIGILTMIGHKNYAQCKASFLGADTTVYFCPGSTIDLTKIYEQANLQQKWTTDYPYNADKTGIYTLIGTRIEGCSDTVMVTISNHVKPDIGEDKTLTVCAGITTNLLQVINPPDYDLTWSTENPATVLKGIYRVIGTDKNNCNDTAYVEIKNHPTPDLGANQAFCVGFTGGKGDLTKLIGINTEGLSMNWGTSNPSQALPGTYNLTGTNSSGCVGKVTITLQPLLKPDLGEDQTFPICWNAYTNLNDRFDFTNMIPKWDAKDPELAEPGIYQVIATEVNTGCKDTALVMVTAFPRPGFNDTTIFACEGKLFDLNTVFNLENFPNHVWETDDPAGVLDGTYSLLITDDEGCEETIFTTIIFTAAGQEETLHLTTYKKENTPSFTTNHFRTILADKFGNIYAGAQEGGLYFYNGAVWVKSDFHAQNTYKDLIEFPYHEDDTEDVKTSQIFAASIGHENLFAYAGGVDKIFSFFDHGQKSIFHAQEHYFGSYWYFTGGRVVDTMGGLRSRYSNSLTIGSDDKLYVAQGQILRYDTVYVLAPPPIYFKVGDLIPKSIEGGVFEYDLLKKNKRDNLSLRDHFYETKMPLQLNDVRVDAAGWRNEEEVWFAVDRSCFEGVCTDPYIVRYSTKGTYKVDLITEAISPIPFSTKNYLTIRTIFTDSEGRTFVGMSDGIGFAVMDKFNQWSMVHPGNSKLPIGAGINFNAITEINGKVWIGTTKGLLVFDGTGSLTNCNSYTLYTTENGLPSNNVTDVAFDNVNGNIWLTTDNGVCSFESKAGISGIVHSMNIIENRRDPADGENKLFRNRNWLNETKRPLIGATVKFFDHKNNKVDEIVLDNTGAFKWRNGKPGESYRVVISYYNDKSVFEYKNVKWNASLGEVNMIIDDDMLSDLKEFETDLTQRFNYLPITPGDFYPKGFDTTGAHKSYLAFQDTIKDNHSQKVQNLLLYALTLKSIKEISESSALMGNNLIESMSYAIETILGISNSTSYFSQNNIFNEEEKLELFFVMKNTTDLLGETLKTELLKTSSTLSAQEKKNFKKYSSYLTSLVDIALELSNNKSFAGIDEITDYLRNDFYLESRDWLYTELAQKKHKGLVTHVASSSYGAISNKKYDPAFNRLLGFHNQSLSNNILRFSLENAATINSLIGESNAEKEKHSAEDLKSLLANDYTQEELEAKTEQLAREIEKIRMNLLMQASVIAVKSAIAIADSALKVFPECGFPPLPVEETPGSSSTITEPGYATSDINLSGNNLFKTKTLAVQPGNASALQTAYLSYKQKISAIKSLHNMPYDSAEYKAKSTELRYFDSLYSKEMSRTLHTLWPTVPAAIEANPGFESRLDIVIDSFVAGQYKLRQAYFLKDIAYRISSNKPSKHASIDSLIDKIILLNDSAVAGIDGLLKTTRNLNITGPATLVQDNLEMRFNHQPGSTGQSIYTFVNYGEEPQYNVSFKVSSITGGFTLTGSDSLFINAIFPGEAKMLVVNFTAPQLDTIGSFNITVTADNGNVPSVRGTLYTLSAVNETNATSVKSGLWSDPTTWSTGRVPINVTAVTIKHNVTVDIDATCKTLKAESLAQVQVAAGKKLTVLE